jgi:hypothetical protein
VPPEQHKDRPRILRKLEKKIRAYFTGPLKIIPSLNLANGKDRQQRAPSAARLAWRCWAA